MKRLKNITIVLLVVSVRDYMNGQECKWTPVCVELANQFSNIWS